jgi:hypothetical protein
MHSMAKERTFQLASDFLIKIPLKVLPHPLGQQILPELSTFFEWLQSNLSDYE